MSYPNYLIHYNKNHSSKNGQFVSGDGDGDGITNDHAQRKGNGKNTGIVARSKSRKQRNTGIGMIAGATALGAVGYAGNMYFGGVGDNVYAQGVSFAAQCAAIPIMAIGISKAVKGSVNMGKASRRGDYS